MRGRQLGARGLGRLNRDRPAQHTEVLVRQPQVRPLTCHVHVATTVPCIFDFTRTSARAHRRTTHATLRAVGCMPPCSRMLSSACRTAYAMLHAARCASSSQSPNNYLVGASLQVHGDVSRSPALYWFETIKVYDRVSCTFGPSAQLYRCDASCCLLHATWRIGRYLSCCKLCDFFFMCRLG